MRNGLGNLQTLLVLGGTSAIGLEIAVTITDLGVDRVVLAGRDMQRLATAERDLRRRARRPLTISLVRYEASEGPKAVTELMSRATSELGDLDVIVLSIGTLPDQRELDSDIEATESTLQVNFLAPATLAHAAAGVLGGQGHGNLVVLSSAAAVRPRRSILTYSAAKAGLDAFSTSLAESLRGSGARVLVVRPGHVRSPMTVGLATPPMCSTPRDVARGVRRGLARRSTIVWVPAALGPVMAGLRSLPGPLARRWGLR